MPEIPFSFRQTEDLWFRPLDVRADQALITRVGRDSWKTVFGDLKKYSPRIFMENTCRMAQQESSAFVCMRRDADVTDRVAGMLLLDTEQDAHLRIGHISLIYLEPEFRHRGLGGQLIGRAAVSYRRLGRDTLRLHVASHNKSAISFYQKHGFTFSPKPLGFSGQLVMKKNIKVPTIQY